jgi:hypothetical protein
MRAMEHGFHATEQKADTGGSPFRTLGALRDEEAFDLRPTNGTGFAKLASMETISGAAGRANPPESEAAGYIPI